MYPANHFPAILFSTIALGGSLLCSQAASASEKKVSPSQDFSSSSQERTVQPQPSQSSNDVSPESRLKAMPGLEDYLDANPGEPAAVPTAGPASSASAVSSTVPGIPALNGKEHYPWRLQIVTTTFWVGEGTTKRNPVANHASSWDPNWARNYGGTDDPDNRANYIPTSFTPRQNPFYCALPYNDVQRGNTKPEASKVIPWFREAFKRNGKSVLKGRWVAIRFQNKIAYAQWEDAGPFRTDHWQYVFGQERPKRNLNKGAGLDVSPAVRDFLGMKSTDVTDWRFVDFSEVPHGPWAAYGENNTFVLNARKGTKKTILAADMELGR